MEGSVTVDDDMAEGDFEDLVRDYDARGYQFEEQLRKESAGAASAAEEQGLLGDQGEEPELGSGLVGQ